MRNIHLVRKLMKVYTNLGVKRTVNFLKERNFYVKKDGNLIESAPGCQPAVTYYCQQADELIEAGISFDINPLNF